MHAYIDRQTDRYKYQFCLFFFFETGFFFPLFLCNPGCPGIHAVDQADLEFRDLPVSALPRGAAKHAYIGWERWFSG